MPLKVKIDMHRCVGHSRCNAKAPEIYDVDDDGAFPSDGRIVSDEEEPRARRGMIVCPERAISLVPIDGSNE